MEEPPGAMVWANIQEEEDPYHNMDLAAILKQIIYVSKN